MRRYPLLRLGVAAGALILAGCAPKRSNRPATNRNVITAVEIEKSGASSALEAVQRLRPHFLSTRGAQSIQDPNPPLPIVYLDGARLGLPNSLAMISAASVATIEYLSSIDASARYGMGHQGGAILVTSRR